MFTLLPNVWTVIVRVDLTMALQDWCVIPKTQVSFFPLGSHRGVAGMNSDSYSLLLADPFTDGRLLSSNLRLL